MKSSWDWLTNAGNRAREAGWTVWYRFRGWVESVKQVGDRVRDEDPRSAEDVIDVAAKVGRERRKPRGKGGSEGP